MSRREVQFEQAKALILIQLYLGDSTNMNGAELDKNNLNLRFESDDDALKMFIFYFIELAMICMKMR